MGNERQVVRRRRAWPPEAVLDKPQPLVDQRLFSHSVISPLRYPGAKRQLVPVIEGLIAANIRPRDCSSSPFAAEPQPHSGCWARG